MTQLFTSNFHFNISSRSGVKKATKRLEATHLLSMTDLGRRTYTPHRVPSENHLQMHFDDEENPNHLYAPTREDIAQILHWTSSLPQHARLVINCEAGRCRSAAAALLVMAQRSENQTFEDCLNLLLQDRSIARPNTLMIQYGDELLGANGDLYDLALRHAQECDRRNQNLF